MHILFLAGRDSKNPLAGGGDIQAWEWARYMAQRGAQVTYVCSGYPGLPKHEVMEDVRVLRAGSGLMLTCRAIGHYLRHRKSFDLVYEDVIGGSRLPFLSALYARKPIIVAWHQVNRELFYDNYPAPLAFVLSNVEKMLAWLYRHTLVWAPSEAVKEQLHRELGLPLDSIHVIPASIPDEWFAATQQATSRPPTVICISNLRRYKAIHTLIEAFPLVQKEVPEARLIIVGRPVEEDYEAELRSLASGLGIAETTEFHIGISEEEKSALLQRSRVLALPSRREGFGIVVLEANACGVPVVASSGVPEGAVRHEHNGLRYPFGDTNALARSISRLLKDDTLHTRLSRNSLAFAREFSWSRVGAQFADLVKLAVDRRKAGRSRA